MIELKTKISEFDKCELQQKMQEDCLSQDVIIILETGRIKEMKGDYRGEFLFSPRHFKSIKRVIMLKDSGNIYEYSFDWEASERADYTRNVKVKKLEEDFDTIKETVREEFLEEAENKIYINSTDINAKITAFEETDKYIEYEYKILNWESIRTPYCEDCEDDEDDEWI